jgi:hypothetical protein
MTARGQSPLTPGGRGSIWDVRFHLWRARYTDHRLLVAVADALWRRRHRIADLILLLLTGGLAVWAWSLLM